MNQSTLRHPRAFAPLVLGLAGIAGSASGQTVAVDGNMIYRAFPPQAMVTNSPANFLIATGVGGTDHGVANGWFVRRPIDRRPIRFRDDGAMTMSSAGSHLDIDWADFLGLGFRASIDVDVYSTGPTRGVALLRMTLRNSSGIPLTLDLFNYNDFNVGGVAQNFVTGGASTHVVTDAGSTAIVEYRAFGNTHSDLGERTTAELGLASGGLRENDLPGNLPPFAGNYCGAFEWADITLADGEARTFTVLLAVDEPAACPPVMAHYGSGRLGSGGVPLIDFGATPIQDPSGATARSLTVQVGRAAAASDAIVIHNFQAAAIAMPGLLLLVDPVGATVQLARTDAVGAAMSTIAIPPSPQFCGLDIYSQWFVGDPGAANGWLSSTWGLHTRIGQL